MPSILSKNFPHSSCSTAVCCTMPSIRDFCCPGTGNTQIVGMCWSTVPPLFSQITWVSTLTCSAKALRSKIKTFSHGSSARWMAYLPHKNESLLLKRGEVQSLAPLHRMELCVWTDLNPMWSRDWFSMNPLLQCWQALCAFCSVPRLQQGRCLWFASVCPHHRAQPVGWWQPQSHSGPCHWQFPVAGPEPSKMPASAWRARGRGGVYTLQVTLKAMCFCLCVKWTEDLSLLL